MKEQEKIPTSRLSRTGKFLNTGAKVGGNYLKYYGKRLFGNDDPETLQEDNASDIYNTLSELKGSALKVAQMMSMDQGVLPEAYTKKFTQAQYSAPPLSYPLVVKTFNKYFQKGPTSLFDQFEKKAFAAASIGQVHKASRGDSHYAVKIQYPGVSDSVSSDLKMIRPIVSTMFNISSKELDFYLEEIEARLLEETDYKLELKRSQEISEASAHIEGLRFPKYYPEHSSERILTMDWMAGQHLNEFLQTNPSQEVRNKIGQVLWDFYDFQIHQLKQVHADPHPGNFLLSQDGTIGIIDFGCVKEFPEDFYKKYFQLMDPSIFGDSDRFTQLLFDLEFLLEEDNGEEVEHFKEMYMTLHELLGQPFFKDSFDFSDQGYFDHIFALSDQYSKDKMVRKAKAARGPRDAIYLNRTYFGLYSILHQLGAEIETRSAVTEIH